MLRNTSLATFVATTNLIAFSTVGLWMPLFLKEAHGWSTAEYRPAASNGAMTLRDAIIRTDRCCSIMS